jgi:hypothetical protein
MKKIIQFIIFIPAFLGWIIFAPSFRLANALNKKWNLPPCGSSRWFFSGVEAKDHETYYDGWEEA